MAKKSIIIRMIMVLTVSMLIGCGAKSDISKGNTTIEKKINHYGEAIITEVQREAPDDIYTDSGIVKANEYIGMTKKMEVYGLTFFASDNIPDEFMNKVATTFKEMFPKLEGVNASKQEEVLENLYKYKACLPIVTEKEMGNISMDLINEYSVCDIIMKVDDKQTMEVVEHLLHATTDVGFSYAYPKKWGFAKDSEITVVMNKAIEDRNFNISGYEMENEEVKQRILVQEFAYWLITSEWNIQERYGSNEQEWTLNTSQKVEKDLPLGKILYNATVAKIMTFPKAQTLENFKK